MNKQSKEFSWKRNPEIHQRRPFRRGEHAVQTDHSRQTCPMVFEQALSCNWTEKKAMGTGFHGNNWMPRRRNPCIYASRSGGSPGKYFWLWKIQCAGLSLGLYIIGLRYDFLLNCLFLMVEHRVILPTHMLQGTELFFELTRLWAQIKQR